MSGKKSNIVVGSNLVIWIVAIGFIILFVGLLVWVMQNSMAPE